MYLDENYSKFRLLWASIFIVLPLYTNLQLYFSHACLHLSLDSRLPNDSASFKLTNGTAISNFIKYRVSSFFLLILHFFNHLLLLFLKKYSNNKVIKYSVSLMKVKKTILSTKFFCDCIIHNNFLIFNQIEFNWKYIIVIP